MISGKPLSSVPVSPIRIVQTSAAIAPAAPSPGAQANRTSRMRTPITGQDCQRLNSSTKGMPMTQPIARPITPNCTLIRKISGISAAPKADERTVIRGWPSALTAGWISTCSVMKGMASANSCTSGTISTHLGPNSV